MELTNEFSVGVPVHEAWALLTDLERIAPCMPGFELQEVAGEEYRGAVKVKVGPIIAQYKGVASFRERDEHNHRAVVRAEGRDTRGQGNASATVTAVLVPEGDGTRVTLHTDLAITGKVAQFGRGVLADVSTRLLGQFVQALEAEVQRGAGTRVETQHEPVPAPTTDLHRVDSKASEPIDLLATAGSSVIKRVGPLAAGLVAGLGAVLWLLLRG